MGAYRFTNNAESTLAAGITAGDTALTVASAASFPTAGNFTIVVDSEIMLVTGVAGATFTIVRAQESTSAAAHALGATVRHVVTADALEGGLIPSGTSFPTAPSQYDRFFRTDRAVEYYYDGTRWLSTQRYEAVVGVTSQLEPYSPGSLGPRRVVLQAGSDKLVEAVYASFYVTGGTALSASHKWVATFTAQPSATVIGTLTIDSGASNAYRWISSNVGVVCDTADVWLDVSLTSSGSPGTLHIEPAMNYRLVG